MSCHRRAAEGLRRARADGWAEWIRTEADERAVAEGYWFDPAAAEHVRDFFRLGLRHSKGEFAGKPFDLLEWQWKDFVGPLFGWMKPGQDADGRGIRRYNVGYVGVPKKNGKSTICAGLSLYMLVGDREPGAEVYSAANDKAQAAIIYREAAAMVDVSPALKKRLVVTASRKNIAMPSTKSYYEAMSADVPTKEGLNIHYLTYDELHAQAKRDMWDTLRYGGSARRQPLILAITTAGYDLETICGEQYQYAKAVIKGDVVDLNFFALVYEAEQDEDWESPDVWRKANPSLGVTLNEDLFARDFAEAKASRRKENSFRRYRLNQWTKQVERWLDLETWRRSSGLNPGETPMQWRIRKLSELRRRPCIGSLDLGSTSDLTAHVLLFGDIKRGLDALPWFWMPGESVKRKDNEYRAHYEQWIREGWVLETPGDQCDYNQVYDDIAANHEAFTITKLGIDAKFQGLQIGTDLAEDLGLEIRAFNNTYSEFTAPCRRLEELIGERMEDGLPVLRHGDNPVLNWMATNVCLQRPKSGEEAYRPVKPSKGSPLKIDGMVCLLMCLAMRMVEPEKREPMIKNDALRKAMLE